MNRYLRLVMTVVFAMWLTTGCGDDSSGGGSGGSAGTGNLFGGGGTHSSAGTSSGTAGTSSNGGATTDPNEVFKKCNEFTSTYCDFVAGCLQAEQNIDHTTGYNECIKQLPGAGVDCAVIKQVTAKYNGCIDALEVAKCPSHLPDECKQVLLK